MRHENIPVSDGHVRQKRKTEGNRIIKAMRLYLGMSQAEAAKKIGMAFSVYARYENIVGHIHRGNFTDVCRILEVLHLNPQKFYQDKYELNELGELITSRGTGPLNHLLRKSLRNCCPVICKNKR